MQFTVPDYLSHLPGITLLLSPRRVDRELIANFFMTFARAEFALKSAGFFSRRGKKEEIKVEWEKFAKSIAVNLKNPHDHRVKEAIHFLTEKPPKRHVVGADCKLTWKERTIDRQEEAIFLVRSVTTVRNNLFHGGKELTWVMVERDRKLLESSLALLAHCICLNENVKHYFEELPPSEKVAA